jgi:hypothetical protein
LLTTLARFATQRLHGTKGVHGLLALVDESSDYVVAAMTKQRRTEDWLNFVDAIILMYKRYGWDIKRLLTDRAPELYSADQGGDGLDPSKWMTALRKRGVEAQYTLENQPQPHGRVEIKWQHAQAGGRARMLRTSLNDTFFLWSMLDVLRLSNAYSGRDSERSCHDIFCGAPLYLASEDRVWGLCC